MIIKLFNHYIKVGFRCGLAYGYLCKVFYPKTLGIVVTASHNPMKDNGIKLIDENGGYLRINLERYFNKFVNEPNLQTGLESFQSDI